jgi:hypothetical protein
MRLTSSSVSGSSVDAAKAAQSEREISSKGLSSGDQLGRSLGSTLITSHYQLN